MNSNRSKSREWGDFQTPRSLARKVCKYLAAIGVEPKVVIEPTCGVGNFICAVLDAFPTIEAVYGVEIRDAHLRELERRMASRNGTLPRVELQTDNIFTHSFPEHIRNAEDILIVGNPPWVTNAELGALGSDNLPSKRNFKALNGMDALTGKSNFDLAEFIIWRMLELFSGRRGTLAMLCKNSVVKNIVEVLPKRGFAVSELQMLEIDAPDEFGATVDASLFVAKLGEKGSGWTCTVASLDAPETRTRTFGWTRNRFVADVAGYGSHAALEGTFRHVWRAGIKHDCAAVMELALRDGAWVNGADEVVDVESEWVYPLLKSSDLKAFHVSSARKAVIVPQRSLGEDTSGLARIAPKLWRYLTEHRAAFERRKSSVYQGKFPFAVFGVGDYSFKPYKVAISGFYKEPRFSLLTPVDGRPPMTDDTCYFVGFDDYKDAVLTATVLNSGAVLGFLKSIAFADAKRPYTKDCLSRVDLTTAASRFTFGEARTIWEQNGFEPECPMTEDDLDSYRNRLMSGNTQVWKLL